MASCDPVKKTCCYTIVVQRKHAGRVEVAEFHNRSESEARGIQRDYSPGTFMARRENWKITAITPTRCGVPALDGPRRRRRRRRAGAR